MTSPFLEAAYGRPDRTLPFMRQADRNLQDRAAAWQHPRCHQKPGYGELTTAAGAALRGRRSGAGVNDIVVPAHAVGFGIDNKRVRGRCVHNRSARLPTLHGTATGMR